MRERFDDWVAAWEEAVTETSTDWAPWYVVPADRNWVKALAVAELVAGTLEALDPKLPEPEEGIEGLQVDDQGCRDVGIAAVDPDAAVGGES